MKDTKVVYVVSKEYLTKKDDIYESKALSDEVSKHKTLETAIRAVRNQTTSILSFRELNKQEQGDLCVLSVCEHIFDGDLLTDIKDCDVYGVLK